VYGVRSVPTVVFEKDGVEVKRIVGAHPLQSVKQIFESL
ncbi:hypothetical protein LCGC14_1416090, partial [marine sediment metagenome]